jgi:hypothetical protein
MNEVEIRLHEYFFWSPLLGDNAVRFSVFDGQGREYFAIVPVQAGRWLREARQHWGELLYQAIADGRDPGEVYDVTRDSREQSKPQRNDH